MVRRESNRLIMDFPSRSPEPIPCTDDLVAALGAKPAEVHTSRDLLAVFE